MNHLFHLPLRPLLWSVSLVVCLGGTVDAQQVQSYSELQKTCQGRPTANLIEKYLASFVVDKIAAAIEELPAVEHPPQRSLAPLVEDIKSIMTKVRWTWFPLVALSQNGKMGLLHDARIAHTELSRALRILEQLPPNASVEQVHAAFGLLEDCLRGLVGNVLDPKSTWSAPCAFIEDASLTATIQRLGGQVPDKIPLVVYWATRSNNREMVKAVLRELRDDFAKDIESYVADLKKVFTAKNLVAKREKARQLEQEYGTYAAQLTDLYTIGTRSQLDASQTAELQRLQMRQQQIAIEKYHVSRDLQAGELYNRLAGSEPIYICEEEKPSKPTAPCGPPPPETRPAGVTLVYQQTSAPTNAPPVL